MRRWIYIAPTQTTAGNLTYCPQNITLFRQVSITTIAGTLVYCPQDINQFSRP